MHRYLITPLAGVECDPPAPWTADAVESKVSDVSLLDGVSSHLTAQLSGSARVDEREVWRVDCLSGDSMEVFTVLALIDRVPDENERERYASHGETRKRQPSDTGGRSPGKGKSRSPQPFNVPARIIPTTRGRNGQELETVMPDGGIIPNRAENAAAQRDLAAAGLGTLNGRGFGTAVMINPEHYVGIRRVESDASAPLAIIAARVSAPSDEAIAERLAARPDAERIGTTEAAPQPKRITARSPQTMSGLAVAVAVGRFLAAGKDADTPGHCRTCLRACGSLDEPRGCCQT